MTVIEVFTHILTNTGMIAISIAIVMMIEDLNNKRLIKKNNYDGEISALVLLLFMIIVYSLQLSLYYNNLYS
jgi:hypothetical protein